MALETFAGAVTLDDQSPEGRAAIFDLLIDMQTTFSKLESLRIPVIAAIQGGCIGGAVDMVFACRKSTLAWWPMSALCSACRNSYRWPW